MINVRELFLSLPERTFFVPLNNDANIEGDLLQFITSTLQRDLPHWDGTFHVESSFSCLPFLSLRSRDGCLLNLPERCDAVRVYLSGQVNPTLILIVQCSEEKYTTPWYQRTKINTSFHDRLLASSV